MRPSSGETPSFEQIVNLDAASVVCFYLTPMWPSFVNFDPVSLLQASYLFFLKFKETFLYLGYQFSKKKKFMPQHLGMRKGFCVIVPPYG